MSGAILLLSLYAFMIWLGQLYFLPIYAVSIGTVCRAIQLGQHNNHEVPTSVTQF
jgi:hypothetical protein